MPVTLLHNTSNQVYEIPNVGFLGPDQRVSVSGAVHPINLANYPGVVDVEEEEAAGNKRDYHKKPEKFFDTAKHEAKVFAEREKADAERHTDAKNT